MKTVVISGGTGNDALIRGLKHYYPSMNCKVIVNAYDNGKSTGICRTVTDRLGVSDIRKNHIRMYMAMNDSPNMSIVEFYENRYNFTQGNEVEEICEKLKTWDLERFEPYVKNFFKHEKARHYCYNDFNVSNIVYSEMYVEEGYEFTNYMMCKELLGIDDFVILNSYDNIYIEANTEKGKHIDDEGEIVEWCNPDDKIVSLDYASASVLSAQLNSRAIEALEKADLVVISTGTFWSSIFPTLEYGDFYKYINQSKAKKIWAFNCNEDKDSYGVCADEFIDIVKALGLNLDDFTLLFNKDAVLSLRDTSYSYRKYNTSMENNNGKHSSQKYAEAILKIYYGLADFYPNHIAIDFDDTIWPRGTSQVKYAADNLEALNYLENVTIISGNSFDSIKRKLSSLYGETLSDFYVPIWADASTTQFVKGKKTDEIHSLFIKGDKAYQVRNYFEYKFGIKPVNEVEGEDVPFIKFKPLSEKERKLVVDLYNSFLRYHLGCPETNAVSTGRTTVDILMSRDSKSEVFQHLGLDKLNTLYIGDEIDSGNDYSVAGMATRSIHTSGVEETYCILQVICNDIRINIFRR